MKLRTKIALGLVVAFALTMACKSGEDDSAPAVDVDVGTASVDGTAAPTTALGPSPTETPPTNTAPVSPQIEVLGGRDRRPETEASRELAARLGLAPPDPLFVSDLLTRSDVRELTGYGGDLLETSLEGIAPGPDYNAIRIQAAGGYGFALQVWQFDEVRQLSNQFRRLRETYFDSQLDPAGVANESFAAEFQGLRHYAFLHRAAKSMAVVTCETRYCDVTQIRALAQRVANRL